MKWLTADFRSWQAGGMNERPDFDLVPHPGYRKVFRETSDRFRRRKGEPPLPRLKCERGKE